MRTDREYYSEMMATFEREMSTAFKDDVSEISKNLAWEHMGWFHLVYEYKPLNYQIDIENELLTFEIYISDSEGAMNFLHGIKHIETHLNVADIHKSILVLKEILEENNFDLYIYTDDGKRYRKNADGIKEVTDEEI